MGSKTENRIIRFIFFMVCCFLLSDFISLCSSPPPTKTFHEIKLRVQFSTVRQDSWIDCQIKKRILTHINVHQKSLYELMKIQLCRSPPSRWTGHRALECEFRMAIGNRTLRSLKTSLWGTLPLSSWDSRAHREAFPEWAFQQPEGAVLQWLI